MKIARVVYLNSYAEYKGIPSDEGVDFLRRFGVTVERYVSGGSIAPADALTTQPVL